MLHPRTNKVILFFVYLNVAVDMEVVGVLKPLL